MAGMRVTLRGLRRRRMVGVRITLRRRSVVRVRRRDGLGSRHAMAAMALDRASSGVRLVAGRSLAAVRLVTGVA